jgi:hypothetical protein
MRFVVYTNKYKIKGEAWKLRDMPDPFVEIIKEEGNTSHLLAQRWTAGVPV